MKRCCICDDISKNKVCNACLSITVFCACGCGQLRTKYSKSGKFRKFIHGHNGKGKNSNFYHKNYGRTKEVDLEKYIKQSETRKKKFVDEELKIWNKGLTKEVDRRLIKISRKSSETKKKKFANGESKIWNKGLTKETDERIAKGGRKLSETIANTPIETKLERYKRISETVREQFRLGLRKLSSVKFTKLNKTIQTYLDDIQLNKWKYTGKGEVWISNMNPDHFNINGEKKVIEGNGCFFHGCKSCFPNINFTRFKNNSLERIAKYKQYGYDCLIVWEHDIHNRKYKQLIDNFIKI